MTGNNYGGSGNPELGSDPIRTIQEKPQASPGNPLKDLPVKAFPVDSSTSDFMVLVISGDGGWNVWEESLRKEFNKRKIPVAGLDALKYFWKEKTPEQTTSDLSIILDYYLTVWKKQSVILIGYSFGANIVPFVLTRLKDPFKEKVVKAVLISPDPEADFEIHIIDMLNMDMAEYKYNVINELNKLKNTKILCLFGATEDDERISLFGSSPVRVVELPGNHHFRFNFPPIVDKILEK
jgi:type IV secretory pathway VirJ component